MTIACSIFILDGGFKLFLSAFYIIVTVVPLKVVIPLEKIDFWAFQKIIPWCSLVPCFKKSIFPNSMTTFNGTTAKLRSKAEKPLKPASKVNIERAMTICFQKFRQIYFLAL